MQAAPGGWRRTYASSTRRWLVTNAEARRRDSKTKRRSRIRSTKRGFVKKNVRGFRYKPRGDWFSFGKVRKLCFLCSCIQTHKTSISQRRAWRIRPTSSARNGLLVWQSAEVRKSIYKILNMDIGLTRTHRFATGGGLYSPPEPCETRFIMDACTLFDYFWTVEQKHPPTPILALGRARKFFKITLIGFVWKKKVIYT